MPGVSDENCGLVATPPDTGRAPPSGSPFTVNLTVPPGSPAPGATGVMVAVKVTPCPLWDGLADEVTTVRGLRLVDLLGHRAVAAQEAAVTAVRRGDRVLGDGQARRP